MTASLPPACAADRDEVVARESTRDVYVGRQPIYDRNRELVAYELLFRTGCVNQATIVDGDEATFTVMLNALLEVGLDNLVGSKRAFINVTRNSVLCEYPQFFPKDRVVLEVLENVTPDAEFISMIRSFAEAGYVVALDDFIDRPEVAPLLDLASIIKMDVRVLSGARLRDHAERFSEFGLLAEKVESEAELEECRALGFQWFQGYFLGRPKVITVRHVPTSQLAVLRVLSALHDPGSTVETIAALISEDASLAYRIVRAAPLAEWGSGAIASVRGAIKHLGLDHLRRWITLLSISGIDDGPPELLTRAVVHAKAAELLAGRLGIATPGEAYLAGLLSCTEELVGGPKRELFEGLPLSPEVARAVGASEGGLASVVATVRAAEAGALRPLATVSGDEVEGILRDARAFADASRRAIGH